MYISEVEALGWKISYSIEYHNPEKEIKYVEYTAQTLQCLNMVRVIREVFKLKSYKIMIRLRDKTEWK